MPKTPDQAAPLYPTAESDELPYDETLTMRAWENFLTGDAPDGGRQVRPVIQHSWTRSATSGVDAHASATPLVTRR